MPARDLAEAARALLALNARQEDVNAEAADIESGAWDKAFDALAEALSAPEAVEPCGVCGGAGKPISGLPCICDGKGTQAWEIIGLRGEVQRLRHALSAPEAVGAGDAEAVREAAAQIVEQFHLRRATKADIVNEAVRLMAERIRALPLPPPQPAAVTVADVVAQIRATARALPMGAVSCDIVGSQDGGAVSAFNLLMYAARKCEEVAGVLDTQPPPQPGAEAVREACAKACDERAVKHYERMSAAETTAKTCAAEADGDEATACAKQIRSILLPPPQPAARAGEGPVACPDIAALEQMAGTMRLAIANGCVNVGVHPEMFLALLERACQAAPQAPAGGDGIATYEDWVEWMEEACIDPMPSEEDLRGAYALYAEALEMGSFVSLAVKCYERGKALKQRATDSGPQGSAGRGGEVPA